jgi:xylan 1,4-beta-xylosidase
MKAFLRILLVAALAHPVIRAQTWTADNGNGTYTNPRFFDEFSDPDLIRVGSDFYLTGTTMHSMPGLPILRSRDLVNWTFLSYAVDRLDLGPAFRLENGQNMYGQGIWAPCLRYHEGTFYIFSNVNRQTTQLFRASNPAGPWTRTPMKKSLHDLSVLFDDDGKVWVVWGYRDIGIARLTSDLTDTVPGTERLLIPSSAGMGEGLHLYKIKDKYILTSAWYLDEMRMPTARADRLEGPWEVNQYVSRGEDFGVVQSYRLASRNLVKTQEGAIKLTEPDSSVHGRLAMHQGGIVETPSGEWWGFSMADSNSIGRLTTLSPVTWIDGWPYFGLPGNPGRTPRTWIKPNTRSTDSPHAPYRRDDDFSGKILQPVWKWNHVPVDDKWSLAQRPGFLRLHSMPAESLWSARNTLTQRAMGPKSEPTVVLDTGGMKSGDVAGLALFNRPYAWIGVERSADGFTLVQFDERTGRPVRAALRETRVWLRAHCDFMKDTAAFSYSTDGKNFHDMGTEVKMPYQLMTFQGVRDALFSYNTGSAEGGFADFDSFAMNELAPRGLTKPIPYEKTIVLSAHGRAVQIAWPHASRSPVSPDGEAVFSVTNRQTGRVALRTKEGFLSVDDQGAVVIRKGKPADSETFQWIETFTGELTLMSLRNHRYLRARPENGNLIADSAGPLPDGKDGVRFDWQLVN